jgi:hypothetical protein
MCNHQGWDISFPDMVKDEPAQVGAKLAVEL